MIILDTNVVSEIMRGLDAAPEVRLWIRRTPALVTTVITRAEILAGLALLTEGRRKAALTEVAERSLSALGVCLPLMAECAPAYATIVATRRASGRPIGTMDALIASIAHVSGAAIATRDVADFDGIGLQVVDPWLGPPVDG